MAHERIGSAMRETGGNHILPFLWLRGENEETIREYMAAIHHSNIGAVCLEARPHPDFAGPGWWRDLDIVLDEAHRRGMKVWILDDAHFPTGIAAGKMADAPAALCKQYLAMHRTEVVGPMPRATLDVGAMARFIPSPFRSVPGAMPHPEKRVFDDDAMLCVLACRVAQGETLATGAVDLTALVTDGLLTWDVPAGVWRIIVIYVTRNGGGRTDYINLLDEASCRVLIDAVYEPHYARYKVLFGTVIAGFFFDEPYVGNTEGYAFDESIGRKQMQLPWSDGMAGDMRDRMGADWMLSLPALWAPLEDKQESARARYAYMDAVTRRIQRCFSGQLGEWCEKHGVESIGHVIEDNNQHSRLGCSIGHYFRAMSGQHMAGIDVIGGQVIPGAEHSSRRSFFGVAGSGEFYHFELGKLASSLAHIDPKKKGRALCELYGAYGWGLGSRQMKWIADHLLVRGINTFTPHAFSLKPFPDPDCPPHFYAGGKDALHAAFGLLCRYINRCADLLSGGTHKAAVAVLYHGESEWTGDAMFDQTVIRTLTEAHIDCDILPADVFSQMQAFDTQFDGKLRVNGETFSALIVPYAEFIPESVIAFISQAGDFPVIFVDGLPRGVCEGNADVPDGRVVALDELPGALEGIRDVRLSTLFPSLRVYHYENDGADIYMLFNENLAETFDGEISFSVCGSAYLYDAMEQRSWAAPTGPEGLRIHLAPYESIFVVFAELSDTAAPFRETPKRTAAVDCIWSLSCCEAELYPNFAPIGQPGPMPAAERLLPAFSGYLRYDGEFKWHETITGEVRLSFDDAYDALTLWLNSKCCGTRICPPYTFDVSNAIKPGRNAIRAEVATTLERRAARVAPPSPLFSAPHPLAPIGIVGGCNVHW